MTFPYDSVNRDVVRPKPHRHRPLSARRVPEVLPADSGVRVGAGRLGGSARCAVLLISHPSKATDWRNSVRALWELRAVPIPWESTRSAVRLRNEKASHGLAGAALWLGGYPQWLGMSPTDAATEYEQEEWEPIP